MTVLVSFGCNCSLLYRGVTDVSEIVLIVFSLDRECSTEICKKVLLHETFFAGTAN